MDLVVVPASPAQAPAPSLPSGASSVPAVSASVPSVSSKPALSAAPRQIAQFSRCLKRKNRSGLDN